VTAEIGWSVELDADPDTTGLFIIGESLIGGPDVIAPNERWIDVGDAGHRVKRFSLRRGGSDGFRPYDAADVLVEFDNRTGDFDSDNPYGYYVMGPQRLIHPGTGIRIIANIVDPAVTGVGHVTVYTGVIEEPNVQDHRRKPVAIYSNSDLMVRLGNLDVPLQGGETGTGQSSNARANWLLDQAGIPAELRSIEAGGRACLGTTGEGKVRDGLQLVANGEAGRFYVNRLGVIVMTWHASEYGKTSEADFYDIASGIRYSRFETSPGTSGIINTAVVKRTGPRVRNPETGEFEDSVSIPDVGAVDSVSAGLYGPKQTTVECVLLEDADAASLATFLATRRAQPTTRPKLIEVPLKGMTRAQMEAVLGLDMGSLITITRQTVDGRGLMFTATVESVSIQAEPRLTTVTLTTAPSDTAGLFGGAGWFIIGESLIGGPDVIAPY